MRGSNHVGWHGELLQAVPSDRFFQNRPLLMPLLQGPPDARTMIAGKECLYFVGTSYLGLQGHPAVLQEAEEALKQYGLHSATTRAGYGNSPPLLDVERLGAQFLGQSAAFYFISGFISNGILLASVADWYDILVLDELAHYCLIDAARATGKPTVFFSHRNAESLSESLRKHLPAGARPLLLTDGVFPALGTLAPLLDYRSVLNHYPDSGILVDDAHGIGVLGEQGRGIWEYFGVASEAINQGTASRDSSRNLSSPACYLTGTTSKALGGFGGLIAGSHDFIDRVKQSSHWYDGSTAPPPLLAAATAKSLELVMAQPELRSRLHRNVAILKNGLRRLGIDVDDTPVPIVRLSLGTAEQMQQIQKELFARNIAVAYVPAYAGLGSEGALRLAVFASHDETMIERLLGELQKLLP